MIKRKKNLKKLINKNNWYYLIFIILILAVIGFLFYHYTQQTELSLSYPYNSTINNISISSDKPISQLGFNMMDSTGDAISPSNTTNVKFNNALNLTNISKILISFSSTNKQYLHPGTSSCTGYNSYVDLMLSENNNDVILYHLQNPTDYTDNYNSINGNIEIYKDTDGNYYSKYNGVTSPITLSETKIYYVTVLGLYTLPCGPSNGADVSENFLITNFTVFYKNLSQCQPKTCLDLNSSCGPTDNGCGTYIACGNCNSNYLCSSNKCIESAISYYDSMNNCTMIMLLQNQTNIYDYANFSTCQTNIIHNCIFYNNCTIPPVYNCTHYNNCTIPSVNQISTCYKTSTFLPQISFSDIIPQHCNSYNTTTNCGSNFNSKQDCLSYYNSQPTLSKLWSQYGFLISIIGVIISLTVSIIYILKLFNKSKKKRR